MNNIEKKLNKSADALMREKKADILKYCGIEIKEKSGFNKEKLFTALTVVAVVIFLVSFAVICYIPIANNNAHITAETPGSVTDVYTSTHEAYTTTPEKENGVYIYNGLRSAGEPPFPLPAGIPDVKNGYHVYSGTDYACYAKFTENLKDSGFDYDSTGFGDRYYSGFFIREDSIVYVSYDKEIEELEIFWYKKSPYAPENGVSEDEAVQILYPEKSSSKLELHPLDITPEGFYEKTGAQIFVAPTFSFDRYDKTGHPEMKMAENKHYFDRVTLIKNGKSFTVDYDCIASADIDGDGKGEICFLNYGITSGVFTFGFCALTDKDPYSGYFQCNYMRLSFAEKDGELKVCGTLKNDETRYYDIKIEKSGGKEYINLYSDGKPLSNWGVPPAKTATPEDIKNRLKNNETVYYDEITGVSKEKYAVFYRDPKHPRLMQIFDDYNELQKYIVKLIESSIKLSVNVDISRYVSVYVKEYDNSGYYAVALCNDRKTVFDESSLNVKTEKDDSKRPVVFALIEKGRYESEAKNPASDISGANNKPVGITEAAKKLDGGQSVRLCDVVLPEKASLSVSTFFAEQNTGEPCRNNEGVIILDEYTAEAFSSNAEGKTLAVEVLVSYEDDGCGKKAVILAYLPDEALDDCVKVNSETMNEEAFFNMYKDNSAVYSITDYRNEHTVYYDDGIVNEFMSRV